MPSYNLNAVMCTVNGVLISGAGENGLVKIAWNSDQWSMTKGAGGETVRSRLNDNSATVTFTLMPGAIGNLTLQGFHAIDAATGLGAFPFALRDPHSNDTFTSAGLWIKKRPDREFSREVQGECEWVCETGNLIAVYGAALPSNV